MIFLIYGLIMAKKGRVDRSRFEARRGLNHRRRYRTTNPRKYYLIVSEGTKTETYYFEALRDDMPKGIIDIEIKGKGMNTSSLVNEAIKLRDERKRQFENGLAIHEYDEVWVVFDKDDFGELYNVAVKKADQESIECACSNQAFELWYLLHFDFHDSALHRNQYENMLTHRLGFKYKKNNRDMYNLIKERQDDAIKNAKKLYEGYPKYIQPSEKDPSTQVYKLVEKLNSHKKHDLSA